MTAKFDQPGDPGFDLGQILEQDVGPPDFDIKPDELIGLVDIGVMDFEFNPIINGLLDCKESLLIVAESGTGKSMILNQIMFTLAVPPESGLWGKFQIRRPIHAYWFNLKIQCIQRRFG